MSGLDAARELLNAIGDYDDDALGGGYVPSENRPPRLATVDPAYAGVGNPRVTFDGELTMSAKTYPFLSTRPSAGDRVALLPLGRGYLLLGKVGVGAWYDALVARVTTLESRLPGRVPSSVAVGSGSASVAADGTVTFAGASFVSLNGVFDGVGMDAYDIVTNVVGGSTTTITTRMRAAGVDNATGGYQYSGDYLNSLAGPTRYFNFTSNAAGWWNPSSMATPDIQGFIRLFQPAKPGTAARGVLSAFIIGGGDRWLVREGFNTPGGTFDGFSLIPAVGVITGTVKVVKLG